MFCAFTALLQPESYFNSPDDIRPYLDYHVIDDIDGVVSEGFGYNYTVHQVGDSIMTGEGPWFVSVEENWEETSYLYTGQANYTIIEVDGVLKIANHYWAGLRAYQTG